jgi:hypothetical protein
MLFDVTALRLYAGAGSCDGSARKPERFLPVCKFAAEE